MRRICVLITIERTATHWVSSTYTAIELLHCGNAHDLHLPAQLLITTPASNPSTEGAKINTTQECFVRRFPKD